jgi:hypothetical protein
VGVVALVWLAAVAAASAATLTVTSSADSGTGTLRNAIAAASSGDTVVIDPGVNPQLTTGGITMPGSVSSLIVQGQGARLTTIIGDGVDSTFDVENVCKCGPTLSLTGITLAGGGGLDGGALLVGGGTSATLNQVTLASNTVTAAGGAIEDEGTLTLNGVTASGNNASTNGGAIDVTGGTANINNTTITGNTAAGSGAGSPPTAKSRLSATRSPPTPPPADLAGTWTPITRARRSRSAAPS